MRISFGELGNDHGQDLQPTLVGDAHAHPAVDLLFCLGDFGAQVVVDIQNGLGSLDIAFSRVGQRDGIGAAVENGCAQILLDLLDRLGERRLGDKQLFAGRCD